jgi:SAM-dependent methyltransferase
MKAKEACPVCKGQSITFEFECTDHLVSHRQFPVNKCNECGFMYTGNAPGPEVIGSYYESPDYISHTGGERSITDILYGIARRIMLGTKVRIVRRFANINSGSILDIGAGTGHFVRKMSSSGWNAKGVEVSDTARKYALEVNGVKLYESLSDEMFHESEFDVVSLWHVLEHIHDLEGTLSRVGNLLKPGGVLLLALPNNRSADAQFYRENWAAYDVPRHLWHFNSKSINILVSKYGFSEVAVRRMPFDSFYISILSEKSKNSRFPVITGIFWGTLFWIQSRLVKERCSSLLFIFMRD